MSDLIDRQAAIDALEKVAELFPWRVPENRDSYDRYNEAWNDAIGRAEIEIEELPSAEKPFKLPKIYVAEGFDTVEDEDGNVGFGVYVPGKNQIYVAGDVEDEIRARALLHEVCHWVQDMCGRPFDEDEANEFSDIVYDALPSAQPEEIALHESCTDCPLYDKDRHRCPRFSKVIPETLRELPSAQPPYNPDEWCHDCKEYDQERHCCPRWNRVIRKTVDELRAEQAERREE